MYWFRKILRPLSVVVVAAVSAVAYIAFGVGSHPPPTSSPPATETAAPATADPLKVLLSDVAIANLGVTAKQLKPQTFWKTIVVPGMVVDRPGVSDLGVPTPATGVVARIHRVAGDVVRPGDVLFTLRLLSESLHLTQSELFKATQDVKLAEAQSRRLAASEGAVPEAKRIEVENQIARFRVSIRAYRQELLNRGLSSAHVDAAAEGEFVREIPITVPAGNVVGSSGINSPSAEKGEAGGGGTPHVYEVQELKVELGQQVQAGETLCILGDHRMLAIEGRAFRDETPLLEESVRNDWPVEVDFQEAPGADWASTTQSFPIHHLANTVDPVSRTFAFLLPLVNQSREAELEGRTQVLWRFRPGQRVRIVVRVGRFDGVLVLPAEAVAREGTSAERYVFTQNVNTFERRPVRVLLHNRRVALLPDDGAVPRGAFVVQSAAAVLNRMARAPAADAPKGFHVHADGSLHKNEDEGK